MFWFKKFKRNLINYTDGLIFYKEETVHYDYSSEEVKERLKKDLNVFLSYENKLLFTVSSINGWVIPFIDVDGFDLNQVLQSYSNFGIIESSPNSYWIFDKAQTRKDYRFSSMKNLPMIDLRYYEMAKEKRGLFIRADFKKSIFPFVPTIIQHSSSPNTNDLMNEIIKHFEDNYEMLIHKWKKIAHRDLISDFENKDKATIQIVEKPEIEKHELILI